MSKLISEADKLLERGKIPEAVDKLQAALKAEPLNQLVASKLANIYIDAGEALSAAKVYVDLAERLSEAGKSQVAIAIFKQALELNPNDVNLRYKFALECEAVGKLGDALSHAQLTLQHYLRRKKYFEACNVFPLLVRSQPKDEKNKLAWIEVLQLSLAEQKLIHVLVAFCGPPGLASEEFPVGGDPTALSDTLYEGLKRLVPYFPRDPQVAYAVAWAAFRKGKTADLHHYLRECLRRNPDFCLALLLYARALAEQQKLNEAFFVYRHLKDRLIFDKSVPPSTLNKLLDGFVEKNGWITFTDGLGIEEWEASQFLDAILGRNSAGSQRDSAEPKAGQGASSISNADEEQRQEAERANEPIPLEEVPAEIEIPLGDSMEGEGELELEFTKDSGRSPVAPSSAAPKRGPSPLPEQLPKAEPGPGKASAENSAPQASAEPGLPKPEHTGTVEFTAIVKTSPAGAHSEPGSAQLEMVESPPASDEPAASVREIPSAGPASMPTFNPLENSNQAKGAETEAEELSKTQIFSPMELLEAARIVPSQASEVETKTGLILGKGLVKENNSPGTPQEASPAADPGGSEYLRQVRMMEADGTATKLFSPMDTIQASEESRNKQHLNNAPAVPFPAAPPEEASPELGDEQTALISGELKAELGIADAPLEDPLAALVTAEGEATKFVVAGGDEQLSELANAEGEATKFVSAMPAPSPEGPAPDGEHVMPLEEAVDPAPAPAAAAQQPAQGAFQPAPQPLDMGDDLLEGPTRILSTDGELDATAHFLKEIKEEINLERKDEGADLDMMFRKAERYIAKRNYYLARKVLRHCLALGGDEARIKNRLRDIRKLELPDGLYSAVSSDESSKEASHEILERLELEFDLKSSSGQDEEEIGASIDAQIDNILSGNDSRTVLDFGVALHEMGLFRQAETVFAKAVDEYPDVAFDAYYLAAVSKFSRRDYAGAASILKKLSSDPGRTEIEKIQIYYTLGELFEKMRRPERSKEFFRKVADLDANYRNIRHKLDK